MDILIYFYDANYMYHSFAVKMGSQQLTLLKILKISPIIMHKASFYVNFTNSVQRNFINCSTFSFMLRIMRNGEKASAYYQESNIALEER